MRSGPFLLLYTPDFSHTERNGASFSLSGERFPSAQRCFFSLTAALDAKKVNKPMCINHLAMPFVVRLRRASLWIYCYNLQCKAILNSIALEPPNRLGPTCFAVKGSLWLNGCLGIILIFSFIRRTLSSSNFFLFAALSLGL